ncbi:MAG: tripartite tricarboxylate transporter substrate binding protein [Alphaproteobacteria bacterium]|nr:tripartite tricarboxylate transporter substrate binding protein [Alphaproteobacteria bacterium]
MGLAALALPFSAQAQNYPTRTITVVIPFAGGSASDVVTRIMLDKMSKSMGQTIVVENRPGAGGNTGTFQVSKAAPDGYTLVGTGIGPLGPNKALVRDLGYDPAKDFEPISLLTVFPNIIVSSAKLPVNSLKELIDHAKANPGALNFGSVGIGSSQHLAGELFQQITGTKLTHVPYRNIAQYGPDLIAGQVPLGFQWLPNVNAPLKSGGAKPLAVADKQRLAALPNVPTTAEAGLPAYVSSGWFALLAPRGTPKPIVDKLSAEVAQAMKDPEVREKTQVLGAYPNPTSPEELRKFIAAETAKWIAVIDKAGIKPQ